MITTILLLICIGLIAALMVLQILQRLSSKRLQFFLDEALSGNSLLRYKDSQPSVFRQIGEKVNGIIQNLITETELIENKLQEKNILMHQYIQLLLSIPTAYSIDELVNRMIEGIYKIFRTEIIVMAYSQNNIEHLCWHQVLREDMERTGHSTQPAERVYPSQINAKNTFDDHDQAATLVPNLGHYFNLLQIPVILDDNVIGTLQIANKVNHQDFDEYDLEIGRTISMAIANQLRIISIIEEEKGATEKLSTIIDNISDAIMITDAQNHLVLENPASRDLFSLNPVKKTLLLEKILLSPNHQSINLVLFKPERVLLLGKISTVLTPLGTLDKHIISFRNVTDAKQKEREKSEILFLTATKMYRPLLNLKKTKELFKFSNDPTIEKKLTDEISMVFDLLTKVIFYTEIESGPLRLAKKPSNINDIIDKVIETLGAQLVQGKIKIKLDLEPDIEKVLMDPGRIEEVVNSILQFIIKTPTLSGTQKEMTLSTRTRNSEVLMLDIFHAKFEFNRMEILELTNKNIQVEKFMQSDQDLEDLNLNFAFVNHVLKSHGGSFLVTSEPDIGTWYRIGIPIV